MLTPTSLPAVFNYQEYLEFVKRLVKEEKTSGSDQSENLVYYTGLNLVRMERIKKVFTFTPELSEALSALKENFKFIVLTEAWCGDAAQANPVLAAVSEASGGKIGLEFLLRDENPELMDQFLTNGGRSIPKLIIYDKDGQLAGTWGPRPEVLNRYIATLREDKNLAMDKLIEKVQLWYAKDRTLSTQKEISALLKKLS